MREWATTQAMIRIRLGRKWYDFGAATMSLQQYPELKVSPTVYYSPLNELSAVFSELNPRSLPMCHFANEMGLRIERLDPAHSEVSNLESASGCLEYTSGPVLLLASFITSTADFENLETTSCAIRHVFSFAIFAFEVHFIPNRLAWSHEFSLYSATIGDGLVGSWDIWISGPFDLDSPIGVSSTHPSTIQDIYDQMGWEFQSSNRSVLHFRHSHNSLGKVITSHALAGLRMYSIYSQSQPFDHMVFPAIPGH